MLDRETVMAGFPDSMPKKDCREFYQCLNRVKRLYEENKDDSKSGDLLTSIDRYLERIESRGKVC
ncbi:MAG: hypothetical protein ACOCSJ_04825 [Candidatus Natronoplasma sp.]